MKVLVAFVSFVLALYGCGGGGGGGESFPRLPALMPAQSKNAPIVFLRDGVQVGADVRPANNSLSLAGTHDGVAVSSGRVRDGENAGRVNDFLGKQAVIRLSNTPDIKYIGLFKHKPVIRIRETTSDRYIDDVVRVVQLINTVLPYDKRITVSPVRAPHPGPAEYSSWDIYIPDGQIFVGVAPQSAWPQTEIPPDRVAGVQLGGADQSYIWINTSVTGGNTNYLMKVLAHEIFHALGMYEHIELDDYRSVMNILFRINYGPYVLQQIDRDALYAFYGRLNPDAAGHVAYNSNSLGPWTDTSFHLRGDLDDVSFGVSSRNGLLQPWAFGPSPETQLTDNKAITGSVSWSGRLLGFTAHSESLAGKADLSVNMGTLRGNIDFTNLEHWGVHAVPGAIGSGTRWNDGDLRYGVIVRGNSFVQSGGDAGEVTGMFFGAGHEGMGGVLERSDLSAGFAGVR